MTELEDLDDEPKESFGKVGKFIKAHKIPVIISASAIFAVIIIVIIVAVTVSNKEDTITDTTFIESKFEQVPRSKVKKKLQRWSKIRLTNEYLQKKGLPAGEGCQWPTQLAIDSTGNILFYSTDVAGIFKSVDGGVNWFQTNNNRIANGAGCIAIDPVNNKHVVAIGIGSFTGFEYSYDQGQTWGRKQNFTTIWGHRYSREGLAFDPSSYDSKKKICTKVYFSTPYNLDVDTRFPDLYPERAEANELNDETAGIYASNDGGETFTQVTNLCPDGIVKVSKNGKFVYVGSSKGLCYSDDNGKTFKKYTGKFVDEEITGMDLINDKLYVQTFTEIWTIDTDLNIKQIESPNYPSAFPSGSGYDINVYTFSLKVSPSDPNYMMMSVREVYPDYYLIIPYYSHDGGLNWTSWMYDQKTIMNFGLTRATSREKIFIWNPKDKNIITTFGDDFLMRSTDGGVSWFCVNSVSNIMLGSRMTFNMYDSSLFAFGAQDYRGGQLQTKFDDVTVIRPFYNIKLYHVYGIMMPDDQTVIGCTLTTWHETAYPKLIISHDGGYTFNQTDLEYDHDLLKNSWESFQSLNNPNILFAGSYRSCDNGYSWKLMNGCSQVFCINPIKPHELYGFESGKDYIVVSTDDGETWNPVNKDHPFEKCWDPTKCTYIVLDMAFDHVNRLLYVLTRVVQSWHVSFLRMNVTNGEYTNLLKNQNPEVPKDWHAAYNSLATCAIDPHFTDLIYLGGGGFYYLSNTSVMRSFDRGETWEVISTNNAKSNGAGYTGSFGDESSTFRVNHTSGELIVGTGCFGFFKLSPPYDKKYLNEKVTYHKIVFKTNGGDKMKPMYVANRRHLEAVYPFRKGYTFKGWYTDKKLTKPFERENVQITNSLYLYAKWKKAYTVTYMDGNNVVEIVPQDSIGILRYVEPPKHTGYIFASYFIEKNPLNIFDPNVTLVKDIIVYAGYYKTAEGAKPILPTTDDYEGWIEIRSETNYVPTYYYPRDEKRWQCDIEKDYANDRIAAFVSLQFPKTYMISIKMDTRFRGGVTQSISLTPWYPIGYDRFCDKFDNSGTESVGLRRTKVVHTIQTQGKRFDTIFVHYYNRDGNENWKTIRNSLFIIEIVDDNILFSLQ